MTKKILIVSTSHAKLGDTNDATGLWAEELVAPYHVFTKAGYSVTVASIAGGEIPFDDASLNPPFVTKDVEAFILDDNAMKMVLESVPLKDVKAADYDAIFLPGGHGTCWDFPNNPELAAVIHEIASAGKFVAAVCHGPNGLVGAKGADGKPIVAGKKFTCFTNQEEYAVAKEKIVPFLLEDKLKEEGGIFECTDNWAVHVVRDGLLVTGQNPGSSHRMAEVLVEALSGAT